MKRLNSWIVFLLSVIFFGFLSFKLPFFEGLTDLLSLVLSVTSILFGLLIGFFITEMWNKYSSVRKEVSNLETGLMGCIYRTELLSENEEFKKNFKNSLEKYLISYILLPWQYVHKGDRYFNDLIDCLDEIKLKNSKDDWTYGALLDSLAKVSNARSRLNILGKEKLFVSEWIILFVLLGTIIISVFFT